MACMLTRAELLINLCYEIPCKRSLSRHISGVHDRTSFKCDHCQKLFTLKASLKKHYDTVHEGIKPFDCKFCDEKFAVKLN